MPLEYGHITKAHYLQPEYWNGLTPNVDSAEVELAVAEGSQRFAARALHDRLAVINDHRSLERFSTGDVFDATEQTPGTIVLLNHETLQLRARPWYTPPGSGYVKEGMSYIPELMVPESTLEPFLAQHPDLGKDEGNIQHLRERQPEAHYIQSTYWGVVAPAKKSRENTLLSIPTAFVSRDEKGSVHIKENLLPVTPPIFKVGQVYTVPDKKGGYAPRRRYDRVTLVSTNAIGSEQFSKSTARARAASKFVTAFGLSS